MSKSEILDHLPNLAHGDRHEILERLWEMEEADLLAGVPPDAKEKEMLDKELAEFTANPATGSEWKEVQPRLRQQLKS